MDKTEQFLSWYCKIKSFIVESPWGVLGDLEYMVDCSIYNNIIGIWRLND